MKPWWEEDSWENEGGVYLTPCVKCGRFVRLYKDGLCAVCYLEENKDDGHN